MLVLSEVASLLGKPPAPVLPPWGTGLATAGLRLAGVRIPDEVARQLRYGRGLDNRKLKAAGCRLQLHDPRGGAALRRGTAGAPAADATAGEPYRYEHEVEEFLRYSPSVRSAERGERRAPSDASGRAGRGSRDGLRGLGVKRLARPLDQISDSSACGLRCRLRRRLHPDHRPHR